MPLVTERGMLVAFEGEEGEPRRVFSIFNPADFEPGYYRFGIANEEGVADGSSRLRIPDWYMVEDMFALVLQWATGRFSGWEVKGDRAKLTLQFDPRKILTERLGTWRKLAELAIVYGEQRGRDAAREYGRALESWFVRAGLRKRIEIVDPTTRRRKRILAPVSKAERLQRSSDETTATPRVKIVDGLPNAGEIHIEHARGEGYYFVRVPRASREPEEENPLMSAEELVALALKMCGHYGLSQYASVLAEEHLGIKEIGKGDERLVKLLNARDPWCPFLPELLRPDEEIPAPPKPRTREALLREAVPTEMKWTAAEGDPRFREMVGALADELRVFNQPPQS